MSDGLNEIFKVPTRKIKVYIIGAVRGNPNWMEKFKLAISRYDPDAYETKSPLDYLLGRTEREYMRLSYKSVLWADLIHVCAEHKGSLGTLAEIAIAKSAGITIVYH